MVALLTTCFNMLSTPQWGTCVPSMITLALIVFEILMNILRTPIDGHSKKKLHKNIHISITATDIDKKSNSRYDMHKLYM